MNAGIEPPISAADIPTETSSFGNSPNNEVSIYTAIKPTMIKTTAVNIPAPGNEVPFEISCILTVARVIIELMRIVAGKIVKILSPIFGVTYMNVTANRNERTIPTTKCLMFIGIRWRNAHLWFSIKESSKEKFKKS